jgi:hypothetical protein
MQRVSVSCPRVEKNARGCALDNVEPSNMADERLMNCLEDPETPRVEHNRMKAGRLGTRVP